MCRRLSSWFLLQQRDEDMRSLSLKLQVSCTRGFELFNLCILFYRALTLDACWPNEAFGLDAGSTASGCSLVHDCKDSEKSGVVFILPFFVFLVMLMHFICIFQNWMFRTNQLGLYSLCQLQGVQ